MDNDLTHDRSSLCDSIIISNASGAIYYIEKQLILVQSKPGEILLCYEIPAVGLTQKCFFYLPYLALTLVCC